MKGDSPIGELADVRDIHRQPAAELSAAGWRRVRGEGIVRPTGVRYRVLKHTRAGGAFDAVGFFQDRPVANHAPNQQPFRWQALIEAFLAAVLQEEILAAITAKQDLETL